MKPIERDSVNKRVFWYASYVWGIAGLATTLGIIADSSDVSENLKPNIGSGNCDIPGDRVN